MTSCAMSASMPMFLPATSMCPTRRRSQSRFHPGVCAWFPAGSRWRWPCSASPRDRRLISRWNLSVSVDTLALRRCPSCPVVRGVPGEQVRRALTAGLGGRPPCRLRRCLLSGAVLRKATRLWTRAPRLTRRALAHVEGGSSHRQHLSGHRCRCAPVPTSGAASRGQTVLPGCRPHDARLLMTVSDWPVRNCRFCGHCGLGGFKRLAWS
jgi:hypothetical protein